MGHDSFTPLVYVVLTYRNSEDLVGFFAHLAGPARRVVVVNSFYDEASSATMRGIAEAHGAVFLDVPNRGYGAGNNAGIAYALAHYEFDALVVSNADVEVEAWGDHDTAKLREVITAPCIRTLRGKMQNPYYAVRNRLGEWCFRRYVQTHHTVWAWVAVAMNKLLREGFLLGTSVVRRPRYRVAAAHGAFLIIGRAALARLGMPLFDERMFLFCEEVHLSRLAREKGVRVEYGPSIRIRHKEDGSMTVAQLDENAHALRSWRILYGLED